VPIRGDAGTLGVLCATERPTSAPFAEEDLALARLIAFAAAPRLAPAPAVAAPQAQAPAPEPPRVDPEEPVRVELAREIASALCAEIEPAPLLRAALRPIAELLRASPVSLYLVDSRVGSLALEASAGAGRSDRPRLPRDRGLAGRVLAGGGAVAADAPESLPGFDVAVDTPEDGTAGPLYCVPIAIRGRVLGLARAFLPAGAATSARTAELLASALSAAVRNALLYRSLLESIDDLARARRESNERR
jgi:GAF domain-containing protein